MDIQKYLDELNEKIEKKQLEKFWLLVDRDDFKPIKNISDKEFKEKINKKINYYADKRIANIKIYIKNKASYIKKKSSLVELVFDIRKISKTGLLEDTGRTLLVKYYQTDLEKKKVSLKDVQKFMKLCADGHIGSSVIGGIEFSKIIEKLKEKNIKF